MHEAAKHRGEKPFVCEECGHRASSRNGLQMHIKAIHRLERMFSVNFLLRMNKSVKDFYFKSVLFLLTEMSAPLSVTRVATPSPKRTTSTCICVYTVARGHTSVTSAGKPLGHKVTAIFSAHKRFIHLVSTPVTNLESGICLKEAKERSHASQSKTLLALR